MFVAESTNECVPTRRILDVVCILVRCYDEHIIPDRLRLFSAVCALHKLLFCPPKLHKRTGAIKSGKTC